MYEQVRLNLLFLLCSDRFSEILYRYSLSGISFNVSFECCVRYLNITYKAIVDYYPLRSVFTCALCFKNINVIYQFT